ncbi:ppp1r15b [Pungitius sinensis]
MLKYFSGDGHLSGGHSSSSPAGRGPSPGLEAQESSWLGLLSRPAMALLQRYLPGRPQASIRAETGADWISGGLNNSFVDEESELLRQLDDMMPLAHHPAPHLTHSRHQQDRASGCAEPWGGSTLTWFTADSLLEMGIQTSEEMDLNLCPQTQIGYVSSVKTFFSHDLLSLVSSQEISPRGGKDWDPAGHPGKICGGKSRTWWGSFWEGESLRRGLLSDVSRAGEVSVTGGLCPQQPVVETKVNGTTGLFVQCDGRGWTPGENAGLMLLKEELSHNRGLPTAWNTEGSATDCRPKICNHLSGSGAAAACSEVALLTPDQDNGYSSLEEEHLQMGHLGMKVPSEVQPQQEVDPVENGTSVETEMEVESSEEGEAKLGIEEDAKSGPEEEESVEGISLTHPDCQNRAIAFIMGCPCSDDSSQSDGTSSDDDDDDDDDDDAGFKSEGSSDQSDSTDDDDDDDDDEEDDEASDSEADTEAERMWRSLCKSVDPYNPRNFTAQQHTVTSPPRPIPASTPPSSALSTPASSPDVTPLPLSNLVASSPLTSSSPPSGSDTWDDSTSASEVDEAESLRLFSSFGCSSDPYSPFNFQATFRSSGPVKEAGPRARPKKASQTLSCSLRLNPASPPEYRKEEAEERLDSGFSEPSTSSGCSTTQRCSTTKKVRFCDDVEEFFASCGEEEEDRRGPWEELARDRCRFLRRCQEVEQSIDYCLQPQHRTLVYRRLVTVLYIQDA